MPRGTRQPRLIDSEAEPEPDEGAGAPLAARMRPRDFDEFVGQDHLVGPGKILRRLVEAGQLPSLIFWGPPGSGKTTLARIIAARSNAHFSAVSAVAAGVADLRRIVGEARVRKPEKTILFIDEIHRFNKAQQDAVLPVVEDGTVTLIGATTENPSFEVIGPLLSRLRVFTLNALTEESVATLVRRASTTPTAAWRISRSRWMTRPSRRSRPLWAATRASPSTPSKPRRCPFTLSPSKHRPVKGGGS